MSKSNTPQKKQGRPAKNNKKKRTVRPRSKTGRPTKYKAEYCKKLIAFFDIEPYEDIDIEHYYEKLDENGEQVIKWIDKKRVAARLPTLRRFAKIIEVGISTVYDWLNPEHSSYQKRFSGAFTHAREIRKEFLIENGLQGLYAPASFKFVAINLTDMRDKQDFEVGGKDGEPIPVTIVDFRKIDDNTKQAISE